MASSKDLQLDPDMQNAYDYYVSQCGLGPYPATPTNVCVSVIGNQFDSFDRGMTVKAKYRKKRTPMKISPTVQSPAETSLTRAEKQYKRERVKTATLDFSQPKSENSTLLEFSRPQPNKRIKKKRQKRDLDLWI